ncbi:carbapenem self-resistance protein CarG family protein [Dyella choica]|uniref:Uncharacterized protein n=1 Tax=Dyella choica TaxID=1927959 RepID=A0A3S0PJT0_9GAMM|nr:hypothetical protein [Dyella choica]RUL69012.1 hypothetical protein EKH80_23070 [Dyella choica]
MHKQVLWTIGFLAVFCLVAGFASASEQDGKVEISIDNGINRFVLDGKEFMAVRAIRDNFNAHDFDVVTFYVRDSDTWKLVPLFEDYADKQGAERDLLTVSGGADCVLHDFRLLRATATHPLELVAADRELGKSYADSNIVHFTYFELAKNDVNIPGRPSLYFKMQKSTVARAKYCDVNEALDKELHLGGR